jgi:hypothetical protein
LLYTTSEGEALQRWSFQLLVLAPVVPVENNVPHSSVTVTTLMKEMDLVIVYNRSRRAGQAAGCIRLALSPPFTRFEGVPPENFAVSALIEEVDLTVPRNQARTSFNAHFLPLLAIIAAHFFLSPRPAVLLLTLGTDGIKYRVVLQPLPHEIEFSIKTGSCRSILTIALEFNWYCGVTVWMV